MNHNQESEIASMNGLHRSRMSRPSPTPQESTGIPRMRSHVYCKEGIGYGWKPAFLSGDMDGLSLNIDVANKTCVTIIRPPHILRVSVHVSGQRAVPIVFIF
jgi:hypothetical protein